jgi:hypothetical protein
MGHGWRLTQLSRTSELSNLSLEDLCTQLGMTADGAPGRPELAAEFSRRKLLAQMEAIEVQKKTATYMLCPQLL